MLDLLKAALALAPKARTAMFAGMSAMLLTVSACGSDSPTAPSGNSGKVTGTWVLETVDDEEPPVAVHRGPWLDPQTGVFYNNLVLRVTAGYVEIRENESFYMALFYRVEGDGQVADGTLEYEGEWDLVGNEVVLRVQWPIVGSQVLLRDDGRLHTDVDFMGNGEEAHLHFKK